MMVRNSINLFIFSAFLLVAGSAQAFIGSIAIGLGQANEVGKVKVEFSADAQIETEEGKFSSRMNYKDEKLRDVINMGGQTMTTITRYDLNKTWALLGQGMYMENTIGESEQSPDYKLVERSVVGKEKVNGEDTTKYKTLYQSKRGKFGGFTWYNKDNIAVKGFMISEEDGEKTRIMFNLTNIAVGPQSDDLFELPAGAKPFTMPNFGGLTGYPGAQKSPGADAESVSDAAASGKSVDQDQPQGPSIAVEAADAAKQGVREGTVEESKRTAKDAVKEGFRAIFDR